MNSRTIALSATCLILCSADLYGQIIVRGGTKSSIVQSGRGQAAQQCAGIPPVSSVAPAAALPPRVKLAPIKQQEQQPEKQDQVQTVAVRYLISEPWCSLCPAAKRRFVQSGGRPENIISMQTARQRFGIVHNPPHEFTVRETVRATVTSTQQPQQQQQARWITFPTRPQWGRVDLQTWRHCQTQRDGSIRWGRCAMDDAVYPYWQRYQQQQRLQSQTQPDNARQAFQGGAPADVIEQALDMMQLDPHTDILCDVGSGDGRILLAAAKRGVRGVGVEIDPELVALSRERIRAAGLQDSLHVVQADARDKTQFDPAEYGVTAFIAYQHGDLLSQLRDMLFSGRVCVSLFHAVPDATMIAAADGDMYLWERGTQ
jgi:tRNA G46 methylase TrmB